ncbi:hypothetical protein VNO80_25734 [Phaseolus coccineus]|uniref:Uncharacterized protein n=1 Tax=Phaseolus coccineus TaxID=3886 RepID=A0AAN9LZ61_PHACN
MRMTMVPDSSKKVALSGLRRRNERNLDLNVEFTNEVEKPLHGVDEGNENGFEMLRIILKGLAVVLGGVLKEVSGCGPNTPFLIFG